jgi:hypothetical protein
LTCTRWEGVPPPQALAGDYDAAVHTYRLAAQLDDANTACMLGTVYCQLMSGELDAAQQQVNSDAKNGFGTTRQRMLLE